MAKSDSDSGSLWQDQPELLHETWRVLDGFGLSDKPEIAGLRRRKSVSVVFKSRGSKPLIK